MKSMHPPQTRYTIKQILITNQSWWNFYQKHKHNMREAIPINIVKLLSCRDIVRGSLMYECSNPNCTHTKKINFTCKSKACSSCGKKATEIWIDKQNQLLPNTSWQHITFTMPCELWDFFWLNRELFTQICKIAAERIKAIAKKKNVTPGIFIAIHTFGRNLKRNVHIHLSTTTGGISKDGAQWKKLYFDQKTLMSTWRYAIIKLFREAYKEGKLILTNEVKSQLNHTFTFNNFLDQLYKKTWIVHCSKPSVDHTKNVSYLGRYIKRPAIAESKLRHYDGHSVVFSYLDHKTKTYKKLQLTIEGFISRFIQHIPDIGFRTIRYYGFLANRVRGKLLPLVYQLLGQEPPTTTPTPTYAQLIQKDFHFNPLTCIICGQQMMLTYYKIGITRISKLMRFHRELALLKKI